jgi:rubrerythrin
MSDPTKPTDMGMNRTGIASSPRESKEAIEGARQGSPKPSFDVAPVARVRVALSRTFEPVGTMPPPAGVKGALKAGAQALKGNHPNVFLDLLAERLAFERTGVRLYEALLCKHEASQDHEGGPTREELEEIRDQELDHAGLLTAAIEQLGGDPTVVTPSADLCAVASSGITQVLSDARTTLTEGLRAILIAELTDNDAWLVLSDLAERLGHDQLSGDFRRALAEEEVHLDNVRRWLGNATDRQMGLEPADAGEPIAPAP